MLAWGGSIVVLFLFLLSTCVDMWMCVDMCFAVLVSRPRSLNGVCGCLSVTVGGSR